MLKTKQYKFYPIINDSLDSTLIMIIKYYESKYDVFDTLIKSKIKLDETKIGTYHKNMKKLDVIYLTINHMKNGEWTNAGGTLHTTLILMDKSTIDIRWDTHQNSTYHEPNYKKFNISKFRKIKLQKLKNVKNR